MRLRKVTGLSLLALLQICAPGCSFNNVERADHLSAYFDSAGVRGCFCLYDNSRNEFTLYNKERYLQQFPPGGTFNILTTLVGVQTGKIFDEHTVMDGLTLTEAFRDDSVAFFMELARRLGKDTLSGRIKAMSYGNMQTNGPVDSLWLSSRLAISPDEQLGLVKGLFFNQLSFQTRTQQVVCGLMEREKSPTYTLAYSTGSAMDSTGTSLGWVLGWIEERNHPYFFVLNIDGDGAAIKGLPLLRALLTDQGFFKGIK